MNIFNQVPPMKLIEKGRWFAPEYGQELNEFDIKTGEWKHRARANFGEGRPCSIGETRWSGDSFSYDIFSQEALGRIIWALRWRNGSGEGWLVSQGMEHRGEMNLLALIVGQPVEETRWDMCHFIWQTAHKTALAAEAKTTAILKKAFLEKRMKRARPRKGVMTCVYIKDGNLTTTI